MDRLRPDATAPADEGELRSEAGLPADAPVEVAGDVTPPGGTTAPAPEMQVERSKASTTYVGIGAGLLVLVLVLIFVIQNLDSSSVHFFTANFSLPLGLLILASAVAGGLVVYLASAVRVLQLRRSARRHRKADEVARRS